MPYTAKAGWLAGWLAEPFLPRLTTVLQGLVRATMVSKQPSLMDKESIRHRDKVGGYAFADEPDFFHSRSHLPSQPVVSIQPIAFCYC